MDFSASHKLSRVAQGAARIIIEANRNMSVDSKEGHCNFVTEYDVKVQNYIQSHIKALFPHAKFIGEEDTKQSELPMGECVIVDPIDGTTNFMYDYKTSAISIALLHDRKVVAGVICQPYLNEYFTAELGKGAKLNGSFIKASDRPFEKSLVLFGTSPYNPELAQRTLSIAGECLRDCIDLRRSGSAASDMAWIASGRADLFYELQLSPWDFAAGSLICQEAGAKVVQLDGSPLDFGKKSGVVAGSPAAVDEFVRRFNG